MMRRALIWLVLALAPLLAQAAPAVPVCWPLWGGAGTDLGYGTTAHGAWAAWRCGSQWTIIASPTVITASEGWALLINHTHGPDSAAKLWSALVTRDITDPAFADQLAAALAYISTVK